MDFVADTMGFEVFFEIFRHQVATVGGGVDQHVFRRGSQGSVQDDLQGLVRGIARIEREIVAENDKAFRAILEKLDDDRQVDEVTFFDLDHAQPLASIFVEQCLDQ